MLSLLIGVGLDISGFVLCSRGCLRGRRQCDGSQLHGELGSGGHSQFTVGAAEVGFHCFLGDEQLFGDLAVGQVGGGELGDLAFGGGEGMHPGDV